MNSPSTGPKKGFPAIFIIYSFLLLLIFTFAATARETAPASTPAAEQDGLRLLRLTWLDLAFTNFFPVPGSRFADFTDMNFGAEARLNFMPLNIKPLWLSANFLMDWNKTNSIRLDQIIDIAASAGAGWRFPLMDRVYFTPRYSYGFMWHAAYGDYYNDPGIYPGDSRAGKKRYYLFFDQYMHYEAEFAYDISPDSRTAEYEVFISPSFIHFLEKHRQGLEFGYMIGVRMKAGLLFDKKPKEEKKIPPAEVWGLFGLVFDKDSNEPLRGVGIIVTDSTGKKTDMSTDKTGDFRMELRKDTPYDIVLSKKGYFTVRSDFSTVGKSAGWYDIRNFMRTEFQKAEIGAIVEFGNIYYASGSAVIPRESTPSLDKMAQFLFDNPDIIVELGAHTDSLGDANSNLALSQNRAQSAVDYLVAKGIPSGRITAKGYGETKIKNRCVDGVVCSAQEHQVNRRTELKVNDIVSK